jgi:predicted RNA polymerase sigma factor
MTVSPASAVERVYRERRTRMLAALIRVLGDFELAEDALQTPARWRYASGATQCRTIRSRGC